MIILRLVLPSLVLASPVYLAHYREYVFAPSFNDLTDAEKGNSLALATA